MTNSWLNTYYELLPITMKDEMNKANKNSNAEDISISFLSGKSSDSNNIDEILNSYQEEKEAKDKKEAEEAEKKAKSKAKEEAQAIAKKDAEAAEKAEKAENTAKTQATNNVSSTNAVASTKSSDEIQEEIDELEQEKDENTKKMEDIESDIEDKAKSAEENIAKAVKFQKKEIKNHEEESEKVLKENINAYIDANKKGGEGMSRQDLQENIKEALPNNPELGEALAAMTEASQEIDDIDSLLGDLHSLIDDTQQIEDELEVKQEEYEAAVERECCDPIGFTTGEGEDEVKYDFIIDDGNFDSQSDFLGADNQWAAMTALDTDKNNMVTIDEFEAANIKALKTNKDGSQSTVDLKEEFGEDFSVDLSSYTKGGSHSAIDTQSDKDNDGVKDQELLGTFSVNTGNGETAKGYNTLDDVDFLSQNYGTETGAVQGQDAQAAQQASDQLNPLEYSTDLQEHVNFFNKYTQESESLKSSLSEACDQVGVTKETFAKINDSSKTDAKNESNDIYSGLKKEESQEELNKNSAEKKAQQENKQFEKFNTESHDETLSKPKEAKIFSEAGAANDNHTPLSAEENRAFESYKQAEIIAEKAY